MQYALVLALVCALGSAVCAEAPEPGENPDPAVQERIPAKPAGPEDGAPGTVEPLKLDSLRAQLLAFLKDRSSPDVENPVEQLDGLMRLADDRLQRLVDCCVEMVKQERLQGKIHPEERILVKHRTHQNGIYMKWLRGEKKNREFLFGGHMNGGRLMFAAAGSWIFRGRVMKLAPMSPIALEGTLLPHTEYTVSALSARFIREWRRAMASREREDILGVRYRGSWKPLRKKVPACHVFDVWYRAVDWQADEYEFQHVILGFDPESLLPVVFEGYRVLEPARGEERDEDLIARYHFHDLEVDPGLPADDFSQTNPKYGFSPK